MYPVQARQVVDISFPRHVSPCQVDSRVFYIARNVHGKLINDGFGKGGRVQISVYY